MRAMPPKEETQSIHILTLKSPSNPVGPISLKGPQSPGFDGFGDGRAPLDSQDFNLFFYPVEKVWTAFFDDDSFLLFEPRNGSLVASH